MRKIMKMLPFLLICELAFMLTVLMGVDTGGFMFLLFILIPIVCFVASIIYGVLNEFNPIQLLFPLFVGVLFTVTFYVASKEVVWIYPVIYIAVSLVGNGIGYLFKRFSKRSKQ